MGLALDLAQLALIGLSVGSVISLGSVGLSLAYGVMKFPNIAHGYLLTLAMFIAFFFVVTLGLGTERLGNLSFGWSFVAFMLLAAVITGLIAMLLEIILFRVLRKRGFQPISALIASIGAAIVLRGVVYFIWGPSRQNYFNEIVPALRLPWDLRLHANSLFIFGVTIAVAIGLYILLYRTKMGKAMRATAENDDLAEVAGINTTRVRLTTWFIAGFLAGLAGVLYAVQAQLFYNVGFTFLLPIIAAAILGGIGNPWGALVGGLVIGVSQEVGVELLRLGLDSVGINLVPSGYKPAIPFVIMIIVLLIKPTGLFGNKL